MVQTNLRILLAEDDREHAVLLAEALEDDGYDVVIVHDGRELLHALHAGGGDRPYALVVSDIRMPAKTGLDVLEEVARRYPRLPILLMTAFGDRRTRVKAIELGAIDVLDKPFEIDDLRQCVALLAPLARGPGWNHRP